MTLTISATVGDKALRYLDEGRVYVSPRNPYKALVLGDTGPHVVEAVDDQIRCDCRGWHAAHGACAHVAAVAVVWQERRQQADRAPQPGATTSARPTSAAESR